MDFKIELEEGKYTYVYDHGYQKVLLYGRTWRDLTGDKLVYSMTIKIKDLEEELDKHYTHLDIISCGWESFEENFGDD